LSYKRQGVRAVNIDYIHFIARKLLLAVYLSRDRNNGFLV